MNFNKPNHGLLSAAGFLSAKTAILLGFAIVYLFSFTHLVSSAILENALNDWVFTDWLTNYSAGFVRRGLSGSLLLFGAKNFNLDAYLSVTFSVAALYLIIFGFYLNKIIQLRQAIGISSLLVFLFLPSLLFFPLNDIGAFGRKEVLFLFPMLLNLKLLDLAIDNLKDSDGVALNLSDREKINSALKQYCQNIFIWFNLLCIPIVLSHESIVFLSLPLNIAVSASLIQLKFSPRRSLLISLIIYLPTITAIMAGFIWKGDTAVALNICESWQSLNVLECGKEAPAALDAIGWSLHDGISLSWNVIKAERGQIFVKWLIIIVSNLVFLLFASANIISNLLNQAKANNFDVLSSASKRKIYASFSFKYIIIPIVISAPLYAIGRDWGRWFFTIAISYSFCALTPNLIYLEIANQKTFSKIDGINLIFIKLYSLYSKILNSIFYTIKKYYWLYIIALAYTLSLVTFPHCCLVDSVFHQGLLDRIISLF